MTLLRRIERHLRRTGLTATGFGRAAMKDPSFVHQLRNGREPRPETVRRLTAMLDAAEQARTGQPCAR